MEGRMIYLATPYTHSDPKVRQQRYEKAIDVTGFLMQKITDKVIWSPIVSTHPIAVRFKLPFGADYWIKYDRIVLSRCEEIWVVCMDGWRQSKGIRVELDIASALGLEVRYVVQQGNSWVIVQNPPEEKDGAAKAGV